MNGLLKLTFAVGVLALTAACGSQALALDLDMISTHSKINPDAPARMENRTSQICTWYVFGLPIGKEATPQAAFNEVNDGALYLNHMKLEPKWWVLIASEGDVVIGKVCWNATATAYLPE